MPDASFMGYFTASIYWALIVCWSAILIFYIREYRRLRALNPLIATLIVVIFIDGARTLVESGYFGTWYTARSGLIPYSIYELLAEPEYVVIPKALNLVAALIIMLTMVRRWFRDVAQEAQRHADLARYHEELVAAHQELQRVERLRDDLVHMVAHDMRTPLTSVLGAVRTAMDGDLEREACRELLQEAVDDGERLVAMTNDLLDVSRLESGELPLDREPADLADVLREGLHPVARSAGEKGLTVRVDAPGEPIEVKMDRGIMSRVVTNLVQNAVRHTPSGGTITLSGGLLEGADPPAAHIMVADTGEGMSQEVRERVFDRFFHGARRDGGGVASTGLGLAFCKLAVEAHGGSISVESAVGEGATFSITLPVRPPED